MPIRYVTKRDNWIVKSAFKPTSVKAPSTIMNHAGLMLGLAVNQRWCCEALTRDYSRGICNSPQTQQSEINWIFSTSARETGMFCPQVGFVKGGCPRSRTDCSSYWGKHDGNTAVTNPPTKVCNSPDPGAGTKAVGGRAMADWIEFPLNGNEEGRAA